MRAVLGLRAEPDPGLDTDLGAGLHKILRCRDVEILPRVIPIARRHALPGEMNDAIRPHGTQTGADCVELHEIADRHRDKTGALVEPPRHAAGSQQDGDLGRPPGEQTLHDEGSQKACGARHQHFHVFVSVNCASAIWMRPEATSWSGRSR